MLKEVLIIDGPNDGERIEVDITVPVIRLISPEREMLPLGMEIASDMEDMMKVTLYHIHQLHFSRGYSTDTYYVATPNIDEVKHNLLFKLIKGYKQNETA